MKVFGKVDCNFWTDKALRSVSQDARYLALYLLSCPHGDMLGIFKLRVAYALVDLQWDEGRWSDSIEELRQVGYIDYNDEEEYVSILQFQRDVPVKNINMVKHRVSLLEKLPRMELDIEQPINDLLGQFNDDPKFDEYRNRIDTFLQLFHNGNQTVCPRKRKDNRNTEKEMETEHTNGRSQAQYSTLPVNDPAIEPLCFELWWKAYPKGEVERESPETVKKHYVSAMFRGYKESELMGAVERYKKYCQYSNKLGTRYVFKPSNFLDDDDHLTSDWESYSEPY